MNAYGCSSVGCTRPAYWIPVLVLEQTAPRAPGACTRAEFDLPLCPQHVLEIKLDNLLTEDDWGRMIAMFSEDGKEPPARGHVKLDFKHLRHGYCN